MSKADLGVKYSCYKCQTKFYDLNKLEPICPKCQADQRRATSSRKSTPKTVIKKVVPVDSYDDNELDYDTDSEDMFDDVDDDDSDIVDDSDDNMNASYQDDKETDIDDDI